MSKTDPVVHFEMPYEDAKRLTQFYSKTFGWQMQTFDAQMGYYVTAATAESDEKGPKERGIINGGFFKLHDDNKDFGTTVVISVDNLDESIEKVKSAGGTIEGEPMDIPTIGRYVAIKDTEGNRVGLLQPAEM